MEHAPGPLETPVRVVVRTIDESLDDRVPGLAAEVAFFALLSLPPLLLIVAASISFLSADMTAQFTRGLLTASRGPFTESTIREVIEPTLQLLFSEGRRIDVLSIGFAVTVFSASRAMWVVLTSITIAYDLEAERPSWRQRLYAFLLTLLLLASVPVVVPALVGGPGLGDRLAASSVVPDQVGTFWLLAYWPFVAVLAVVLVATLYHLAAPWWTPWRRDLPGAALTVAIWLAGSAGLRLYTARTIARTFEDGNLYGPLAGPLVLLVWLYVLAFAVLLGAEFNAELERQFPSPEKLRATASERLRRGASEVRDRIRSGINGDG